MGAPKPTDEDVERVRREMAEQAGLNRGFVERHGHAREPVAVTIGDTTFMVIGDAIYKQARPGPYTFSHAIHDNGLEFFGGEMLDSEMAKPLARRHPAMQWLDLAVEGLNASKGDAENPEPPIGAWAAWMRLCYDLFTIRDNATLESEMRERLIDPARFQGARHELYVAALCVAAGFDIEFEDERDGRRAHPEFIGIDKITGAKIAVEAKSRHRRGVKGFALGKDEALGRSVGIRGLVLDAFKKAAGLPLYVFVDANLPAAPEVDRERWFAEIDQTMEDLAREGYTSPCPANAVFFSNDPSHHMLEEKIGGLEDRIWIRPFVASEPTAPHPGGDVFERLVKAHAQRVSPPEFVAGFGG